MGFDLHAFISKQYLCLTSAIEIRLCRNPCAVHVSRPSDVQIGEKAPLHDSNKPTSVRLPTRELVAFTIMLAACQFDPSCQFEHHGESQIKLVTSIGTSVNPDASKREFIK